MPGGGGIRRGVTAADPANRARVEIKALDERRGDLTKRFAFS